MEEQSGEYMIKRGRTRDLTVVTGVREACSGYGKCSCRLGQSRVDRVGRCSNLEFVQTHPQTCYPAPR